MKYHYFYQTKNNEDRDGWIESRDRNAAYALLRKQGIKPYKLIGRNPLAWKRWAAIAVLSASLVVALCIIATLKSTQANRTVEIPRHQIYGDQAIIAEGVRNDWTSCGLGAGEKFLARYAQPGHPVEQIRPILMKSIVHAVETSLTNRLQSSETEMLEYRQIKEIVESMKDEARAYIDKGGKIEDYIRRLDERQGKEVAYYNAALQEVQELKSNGDKDALYDFWEKKNADLRTIGLPMIRFPDD